MNFFEFEPVFTITVTAITFVLSWLRFCAIRKSDELNYKTIIADCEARLAAFERKQLVNDISLVKDSLNYCLFEGFDFPFEKEDGIYVVYEKNGRCFNLQQFAFEATDDVFEEALEKIFNEINSWLTAENLNKAWSKHTSRHPELMQGDAPRLDVRNGLRTSLIYS